MDDVYLTCTHCLEPVQFLVPGLYRYKGVGLCVECRDREEPSICTKCKHSKIGFWAFLRWFFNATEDPDMICKLATRCSAPNFQTGKQLPILCRRLNYYGECDSYSEK